MSRWMDEAERRIKRRADEPSWFRLSEIRATTAKMRRRVTLAAIWLRKRECLIYRDGQWRGLNAKERAARERRWRKAFMKGLERWRARIVADSYEKMTIVGHFKD